MSDVKAKPYPINLIDYLFNGADIELPDDIGEVMDFLLAGLYPREQEFIRLRFIEGKPIADIAPLLGYKTTKSVYRLRDKMKLRLRHPSRSIYIFNGLS